MIRTEKEYQSAMLKLQQNEETLSKQREHLESMHLSSEQVTLALSPLENFYYQLKKEVETFERIKAQDWEFFRHLADLQHIGQLFI